MNKIFLQVNIWMPLVYYLVLLYNNWESTVAHYTPSEANDFWFFVYTFSHYSVGTLQLISGIFLAVAVFEISRFLVNKGMRSQMNYKSLIVNSLSFTLYNISVIGLYVPYLVYTFELTDQTSPNEIY